MTALTGRRDVLVAGTAAIAVATGAVAAQSADIHGVVEYEGGKPIPPGQLQIFLDDSAGQEKRAAINPALVESDGKTKAIEFSVATPAARTASAPVQIVAQLSRADGWLLARGSADFTPGAAMRITLYTVMY